jgi:alpha-galactosidase
MKLGIFYIEDDFPIDEFENASWKIAEEISIEKYWSGADAPAGRHFKARLLWSEKSLYVRFEAGRTEPLIVGEHPNLETKTRDLWERDVCEIFVAPDKNDPRNYFEFEVAPTGEWIDLAIRQTIAGRETDFAYDSKMRAAAKIERDKVLMSIKIDWKAFGPAPKAGDAWRGNLFRCVGAGETRGYLAWRPTKTESPNFHVPEAFGEFEFVK